MPAWNELLVEFDSTPDPAKLSWLVEKLAAALKRVGELRGDRNVILYGSAFLQKPQVPGPLLIVTHEDINGLMSVVYGMDCRPEYLTAGRSVDAHTVGCPRHETPVWCPGVIIGHEAGPPGTEGRPQRAAGSRIHIQWFEGQRVCDRWVDREPSNGPARGHWWPIL